VPHSASKAHPLRVERARRNFSQRMLADFAGVSHSTIVRAERAERLGADARQRICDYLGKSSEELGLIPAVPVVQAQRCEPILLDDEEESDMNRRQALQRLGLLSAAALLGTERLFSIEPWERLSRALTQSPRLDDAALDQLQAITTSYWQLRANMASRELMAGVLGHLRTVTDLVGTSGSTAQRTRLCSIAGEISLIAGQMAFDTNDQAAARGYYRAAAEAATEANNQSLYAVAFARSSFTYLETGDTARALAFVEKANSRPIPSEDRLIRSWIGAIRAEVHASLPDETTCQIALEQAQSQLETGVNNDRYWTGFGAARLADYRGVCYVRLGQPHQALAILGDSLAQLGPQAERRRGRILADMATAHAQLGEVDEACRLAGEALAVSQRAQHSVVVPRLQRFRVTISPWQDHTAVRRFDEQLLIA
jgi:tetratricopeptide (TPR) repeat protein